MSPFARFLRELRDARELKQKDAAERVGYEQSYWSAVERGSKGLPRQAFIDRLIAKLDLTQEEIAELNRARTISARQIVLPANASADEYELWHKLRTQSGRLSPGLLRILSTVLDEATSVSPTASGPLQRLQAERRSAM